MSCTSRDSNCGYRDHLEAFWDGEISRDERQRIEAHLSECVGCRQRLRELQSVAATLKAYGTPSTAWRSDAEFWHALSQQLPPRALRAPASPGRHPSPFLAPIGLAVSSLALRGVTAIGLTVYALYHWQLLPAAVPAALAATGQWILGPWVWQRGQLLYSNMATALAPFLPAPGRVWLLAFEATTSALLLCLAGLHVGWLLRWLPSEVTSQLVMRTE